MLLAEFVPGSFVNRYEATLQPDCNYDWQQDNHSYPEHLLGEIPSWIKSKKLTFSVELPQQNVDINTFREIQANAYNTIRSQSEQASPRDVVGVAGTGKSYLRYQRTTNDHIALARLY